MSSPMWKLRRLGGRVPSVHARQAGASGAIGAYTATLLPKTEAFIKAYDAAANAEANWKKEMKEGRGAIGALVKSLRAWLPSFTRDVPGFSATDFVDRPDVPDDVLADATRLFDVLDGAAPSWKAAFEAEVQPVLVVAEKERREAESADASYQQLLKNAREAGALFDAELQLYRITLGAVLGTSHKDFQRLRASKVATKEEEDTEPLAGGPNAGQPAPTPSV